ncbi:hypothetical protein FB45DRAFT_929080 [Roridomyces roridus]|uniref:Secreted protein n=1 Tax=Roridomyces roridus TaxID=1738132 RepID=A0AAD7BHQ8_9AGAR|nr:hypothetical protein FB45DRAFT_948346 [Roridomyces roridus]KAJ7621383.1 hypothetical protein FB45DRAFT_929080 [Roridomyces roridus]
MLVTLPLSLSFLGTLGRCWTTGAVSFTSAPRPGIAASPFRAAPCTPRRFHVMPPRNTFAQQAMYTGVPCSAGTTTFAQGSGATGSFRHPLWRFLHPGSPPRLPCRSKP